jgi:hypothetical protein
MGRREKANELLAGPYANPDFLRTVIRHFQHTGSINNTKIMSSSLARLYEAAPALQGRLDCEDLSQCSFDDLYFLRFGYLLREFPATPKTDFSRIWLEIELRALEQSPELEPEAHNHLTRLPDRLNLDEWRHRAELARRFFSGPPNVIASPHHIRGLSDERLLDIACLFLAQDSSADLGNIEEIAVEAEINRRAELDDIAYDSLRGIEPLSDEVRENFRARYKDSPSFQSFSDAEIRMAIAMGG